MCIFTVPNLLNQFHCNCIMKKSLLVVSLGIVFTQCTSNSESIQATEISNQKDSIATTPTIDSVQQSAVSVSVSSAPVTIDIKDGDYVTNYTNGNIKVKGKVENSNRVGLWLAYFENGAKQSENNYVMGLLSGKTVVYYPNGQIMYIGYYNNGKPDGQWLHFDDKGVMTKNLFYNSGVAVEQPIEND